MRFHLSIARTLAICSFGISLLQIHGASAVAAPDGFCTESALNLRRSCRFETRADYWLQLAKCNNLTGAEQRKQCRKQALADRIAAFEECQAQLDARLELCQSLGESPYDPVINPSDFVATIDNPYVRFLPGTTFVYEAETDDGTETTTVVVTDEVKVILGVVCTAVRDTVTLDGELVEDTIDWFAQDRDGNVWYFGEISQSFEDGELVGVGGSWQAGVEGAKPGIIMRANPQIGDTYRQEFSLTVAEDVAEVLSLDEEVTVPFGTFAGCLETRDFSPLEPDADEHKFYAPGVGLVLEIDLEDGTRTELVSKTP